MKTEQICRTCLIDDGNFLEISHIFNEITLAQMIQDITSLQVNSADGFTQSVCFKCVEEVKRAHNFRKKCLDSSCALIKLKYGSSIPQWVDEVPVYNQAAEVDDIKEELDDDWNLADFVKTEYGEGDDQSCKLNSSSADNNHNGGDKSDKPAKRKYVKSDKKDIKNNNIIFDCPLCHGLFTSYIVYNKHLQKFHPDKIKDVNEKREPLAFIIKEKSEDKKINVVYKCAMNDFIGNSLTEIKTHIHEHMGDKPITCTECDFRTTAVDLLLNHISQRHIEEKKFSCPECDYTCKSQSALRTHSVIHTSEKNYKCKFCPMTFKRGSDLSRHKKVTHDQRKCHICDICHKAFSHSTSLKKHILVHTGERPHVCHYCGMCFTQAGNLKNHIVVKHLPVNEMYKCDHCEYTTKLKYNITLHAKKHFAEKNIQCPHCPFLTKTKGCLKAHIKTHFGIEKKYSCDMCDYKCTSTFRLEIHKRDHTGERPFLCSICNYSGKSKYELKKHMERHNTEMKFICHNCPYRTNTKEVLQKHLRKHCVITPRGRRPAHAVNQVEMQHNSMNTKMEHIIGLQNTNL